MNKNENIFTDNFNIIYLFPGLKENEIVIKSGIGIKSGADRLLRFLYKRQQFYITNITRFLSL